jgi:hypothetical protein
MEPPAGKLQYGIIEAGENEVITDRARPNTIRPKVIRPQGAIINTAELVLIAALGGIGAYSFLASGIYESLRNYGASHNLAFIPYLPVIIWGVLTAAGIIRITLAKRGSGLFIWLVMICALPSLLAHNTVDWPGIFGTGLKLTTSLGFNSMLALGVLTITGYMILDYLRLFKKAEQNMIARQATPADIENIGAFSSLYLLIAVLSALAATAAVAVLARGLETLLLDMIRKVPWNAVFIGLFCFLLLAFYLYWISARRREKREEEENNPDTES